MQPPLIVGIGGTTRAGSSTEHAMAVALKAAAWLGARTCLFDGPGLATLPHYAPGGARPALADDLIASVRAADGIILASPGYHGSISGLVKNAIDYIEDTSQDARTYLDGLPVGLIVTAYGWQATGSTLSTLRSIVHSLRGWPTPLGVTIKVSPGLFLDGQCTDPTICAQLQLVGRQVGEFAELRLRQPTATTTTG